MTIRITWKRAFVALCVLFTAGMLFAWSGAMQVSASSGHWRITDWFLHWVMRNSVRTYAAVQAPDDVVGEGGLVSAAGHYRQACQVCHGAPGVRPSPVMQASVPPAPDLARTAGEWSDTQLFWIIRHGVKFTAMPHWPAGERNDEVRRMVSFVRQLPQMSSARYRALTEQADGTTIPGVRPGVLATCTGCHGVDGRGRGQGDIPILGGQKAGYLRDTLRDYASGKRESAVMQVAAASLYPAEIEALVKHFAAMPGVAWHPVKLHPLLTQGDPQRQLPACLKCHQPDGKAPLLTGQRAEYLDARLRQWRGDPNVIDAKKPADTMAVIARRIPEAALADLVRALSSPAPTQDQLGKDGME